MSEALSVSICFACSFLAIAIAIFSGIPLATSSLTRLASILPCSAGMLLMSAAESFSSSSSSYIIFPAPSARLGRCSRKYASNSSSDIESKSTASTSISSWIAASSSAATRPPAPASVTQSTEPRSSMPSTSQTFWPSRTTGRTAVAVALIEASTISGSFSMSSRTKGVGFERPTTAP